MHQIESKDLGIDFDIANLDILSRSIRQGLEVLQSSSLGIDSDDLRAPLM